MALNNCKASAEQNMYNLIYHFTSIMIYFDCQLYRCLINTWFSMCSLMRNNDAGAETTKFCKYLSWSILALNLLIFLFGFRRAVMHAPKLALQAMVGSEYLGWSLWSMNLLSINLWFTSNFGTWTCCHIRGWYEVNLKLTLKQEIRNEGYLFYIDINRFSSNIHVKYIIHSWQVWKKKL